MKTYAALKSFQNDITTLREIFMALNEDVIAGKQETMTLYENIQHHHSGSFEYPNIRNALESGFMTIELAAQTTEQLLGARNLWPEGFSKVFNRLQKTSISFGELTAMQEISFECLDDDEAWALLGKLDDLQSYQSAFISALKQYESALAYPEGRQKNQPVTRLVKEVTDKSKPLIPGRLKDEPLFWN